VALLRQPFDIDPFGILVTVVLPANRITRVVRHPITSYIRYVGAFGSEHPPFERYSDFLTATLSFVVNAVHFVPRKAVIRKWLRVSVCSAAFVTVFGATVSRVYFPGSRLGLHRWYLEHVGPSLVGLALLLVVALIAIRNCWAIRRSSDLQIH
jgi:hypothetical protein